MRNMRRKVPSLSEPMFPGVEGFEGLEPFHFFHPIPIANHYARHVVPLMLLAALTVMLEPQRRQH